jgi:hypothetical protein
MAINRASIKSGPAKVTFNSATLFTRDDITCRHLPTWQELRSSMHGVLDKVATDFICRVPLRLWGAWENLSVLFPSAVTTPNIGSRLFGASDLTLVIHGQNQDRITYQNARITRLADLYLGIDQPIFAADLEFTCLIKNNTEPSAANAYYLEDTAAYSDTTFAKTNFKQQPYSAVWGTRGGFTAATAEKGWHIGWSLDLDPCYSSCIGTYDMIIRNFAGSARCIPVEATMNQISAQSFSPGASGASGRAMGSLLSAQSDDLVITGSGVSVTLKAAGLTEHSWVWGGPLRNGEVAWETTVGFTTGTAAARAALA